jgi:hypothetical protein
LGQTAWKGKIANLSKNNPIKNARALYLMLVRCWERYKVGRAAIFGLLDELVLLVIFTFKKQKL